MVATDTETANNFATDRMKGLSVLNIGADTIAWEYQTVGSQPIPWIIRAKAHVDAADLLYARYEKSTELLQRLFRRDPETGLPASDSCRLSVEDELALSEPQYGPVALMLLGLAIENACKALLIEREPSLVSAKGISSVIRTHNLSTLMAAADIRLTESDERALTLLTDYVEWAGRYPIPRAPMAGKSVHAQDGTLLRYGPQAAVSMVWTSSRSVFDVIAVELRQRLGPALNI